MAMRAARILTEEFQNVREFAEELTKNVDRKVLELLTFKPLYRGMSAEKEYGKKRVRTDRKPYSNYPAFHIMLDRELASRGFCARRSNSVFVTSDINFAKRFGNVYTIFPPKGFCFTWNTLVKDITHEVIYDIKGNVEIDMDVERGIRLFNGWFAENLAKLIYVGWNRSENGELVKLVDSLYKLLVEEGEYNTETVNRLLELWNKIRGTRTANNAIKSMFFTINGIGVVKEHGFKPEDIASIFKFKDSSEFIKAFTDTDFEKAVNSGHEIMIHAPYVYFASISTFSRELKSLLIEMLDLGEVR